MIAIPLWNPALATRLLGLRTRSARDNAFTLAPLPSEPLEPWLPLPDLPTALPLNSERSPSGLRHVLSAPLPV